MMMVVTWLSLHLLLTLLDVRLTYVELVNLIPRVLLKIDLLGLLD
jgi:hypothetical protein